MKKKLSVASLLAAATVLAFIMVIIGLAVLAVGGYEATRLLIFCKTKLPTVPTVVTNRLVISMMTNTPPASLVKFAKLSPKVLSTASFTISYGIASYPTNTPWVSMEMKPTVDGEVIVYESNETNFVGSVSYGGYSFRWNATEDGTDTMTTSTPEVVAIERTTNFVDWVSVFTNNLYGLDTVSAFTDVDAPTERAFYRLRDDGKAPLPDWYTP
jgi:hypothetical protein